MTKYPFEAVSDQSCLKHSGQKILVFIFVQISLKDIWKVKDHQGLSHDGYSVLNCLQCSQNKRRKRENRLKIRGKTLKSRRRSYSSWLNSRTLSEARIIYLIILSSLSSYTRLLVTAGWSNWQSKEPIGQPDLAHQLSWRQAGRKQTRLNRKAGSSIDEQVFRPRSQGSPGLESRTRSSFTIRRDRTWLAGSTRTAEIPKCAKPKQNHNKGS